MLFLFPPEVCETLEKIAVMAILRYSGFDMALGYMTYCRSHGIDWLECTSWCSTYYFSMCEVSDVLWSSASLTHRCNADAKPIGDSTSFACPVFLVSGALTPLSTIQALVGHWWPDNHLSEVLRLERPSEVPEVAGNRRACK